MQGKTYRVSLVYLFMKINQSYKKNKHQFWTKYLEEMLLQFIGAVLNKKNLDC